MEKRLEEMLEFMNGAHSVYHGISRLEQKMEQAGYTRLSERDAWNLQAGGKYYMTRGGSALMAFRIPEGEPTGFMMSAAHSDRPTFKVKENGELCDTYTRLAVERYGGMLISTWLDRPLSIAGRVLVETEKGAQSRLLDIDRDLLLIPNVAIHMNRKANDGYSWNPAVDTLPLMGGADGKGKLAQMLEEAAGGKILGHDLYLYNRQKASVWGLSQEYFSSAAIDDLECVFCCAQGFLQAKPSRAVPVLCIFDCEEVGSSSVQGAASDLLELLLERICGALHLDKNRMLSQSFMVSADNAHGVHPNHPEYADKSNAPVLNQGVVLKFNAAQKYTTDGASGAIFRKICGRAGVPVQSYYNRADLPGGSTLGNISLGHVSVPTADIGLPQLAMHSSCETAGLQDALYLMDGMQAFYGTSLECPADGEYILGE